MINLGSFHQAGISPRRLAIRQHLVTTLSLDVLQDIIFTYKSNYNHRQSLKPIKFS